MAATQRRPESLAVRPNPLEIPTATKELIDPLLSSQYIDQIQTEYDVLLRSAITYDPHFDTALLNRAFAYASIKHADQFRRSGEPYILHPIAVAQILTELQMDAKVLSAALLHDVVEDCNV